MTKSSADVRATAWADEPGRAVAPAADSLTANGRSRLERLVGRARALLEEDLAAQAAGRFGIDADGAVADGTDLRLDPSGLADREEIVEVVHHLQSEGCSAPEAIARLIREAVFTHLNRLVAIRIAEALNLLPPSLGQGDRSQGYLDVRELVPLLAADDTNGYWTYIRLCGDELASDVPNLFDPRNPLLALAPSPAALRGLVELFAVPASSDLWRASDCLGWTYQFFNTAEDRRRARYRQDGSPKAPETSQDLAVRNQFFTPGYVVEFLVQNSLGRRLLDADPDSPLLGDMPLLVDPPTEPGEPVSLDEIAVLDPACGSGHFLLGAYDLLERAWQHAGTPPADAAPHIVASLWGIDIDPRCAQVAAAAILFRARRSCPRGELPRPNIICARSLPATATGLSELLNGIDRAKWPLMGTLIHQLEQAPILGPLLHVEESIEAEIRASIAGSAHGALAQAVEPDVVRQLRDELIEDLRAVAAAVTATAAERMLAAEAEDAVRFVAALVQRYDAVLQNPPFGEPVPESKPYIKANYPWIPSRSHDLLAAFVGRGLELCKPGTGYVGAITARNGMFLKTFEDWRREVLLGHRLVALADLGYGVMEEALVEAAAYVLGAEPATVDQQASFIRLLKETDRPAGLVAATAAHRRGANDERIFRVALKELSAVPGSPVAYWMSPALRRLFIDYPSLDGEGAEVRQGMATGDDFRFVRAIWEINPARIARTREETRAGKRWAPFAKGGEYSPYWADIHLVVDWANDGEDIRTYDGSRPQNIQYFFRPGLTWPLRTNSGFGVRVLPKGVVFGHKGPAVFPRSDAAATLGWLKSRTVQGCMDAMVAAGEEVTSGSAARSYEVGLTKNLPWIEGIGSDERIATLVARVVQLKRRGDSSDESTRLFTAPDVMLGLIRGLEFAAAAEEAAAGRGEEHLQILETTYEIETRLHHLAGLDFEAEAYLDSEVGPHPFGYNEGTLDEEELRRFLQAPIGDVIDEITQRQGGARAVANLTYFADRRLEVIAHGLRRPPRQIELFRQRASILPHGEPASSASDVLSYLVGLAVGRWDARLAGTTESPAGEMFDAVAVHPPGMLLHDAQPARIAPPGYELKLPAGQTLLDEPGHPADIVKRVMAAAESLVNDADQLIADLLKPFNARDLRSYLRRHFFKSHLARYTKSRRRAPIYWPLYTPSGRWGLWVYAPSLTRETLYAVEAAATARLNAAQTEISRLARSQGDGGDGRSERDKASALEAEQLLSEELGVFRDRAHGIAALGWEPDLDDGIALCAAPLADLFPAWPEAARQRENIKASKYPWATVSKWADEL